MVLDLREPIHHVVEVIVCLVDAKIECPTVISRTFLGHHDIEALGNEAPLQIHDSQEGGGGGGIDV